MAETFYSVDEANGLIPKLKPLLERIRKTQDELGISPLDRKSTRLNSSHT